MRSSILPRKTKGTANVYDVEVGQRLRSLRSVIGWSQEKLADTLGVTFQQVQKYENGINRIAAGRLYELAQSMGLPISHFFPDQHFMRSGLSDNNQSPLSMNNDAALESDNIQDILRAYYALSSPEKRAAFIEKIKLLADQIEKSEQ